MAITKEDYAVLSTFAYNDARKGGTKGTGVDFFLTK
jgi:hypothetical protein